MAKIGELLRSDRVLLSVQALALATAVCCLLNLLWTMAKPSSPTVAITTTADVQTDVHRFVISLLQDTKVEWTVDSTQGGAWYRCSWGDMSVAVGVSESLTVVRLADRMFIFNSPELTEAVKQCPAVKQKTDARAESDRRLRVLMRRPAQ